MRRFLPLFVLALLAAAAAAPAAAQEPAARGAQGTTATTPPKPKLRLGRMTVAVRGGLRTRRMRYVARGQRFLVVGAVRPFVAGQVVTVELVRGGRVVARKRARVGRGWRGRGRFVVRLVAGRRGRHRIVARHVASPEQVGFRARDDRVQSVVWRAGGGARGMRVLLLQRALLALGYATPVNGLYGGGTSRAVFVFRKVNRMRRTGYASPAVFSMVMRRRGAFRPRYPRAGKHVEFDWSRQVLVLAYGSRPYRTFHTSSGKASTPTVFGTFRFYRKQPGVNGSGMVNSTYFLGSYAIHGYPSVPSYPASHGCIRVPTPSSSSIMKWISLGDRFFSYR